jgi:hypothetical protein
MENETKTLHTPEPWSVSEEHSYKYETKIFAGEKRIAEAKHYNDGTEDSFVNDPIIQEGKANAARIVAAVNHCKGATNEELQAQSWEQLKAQRDELLAALKGVVDVCDKPIWAQVEPIRKATTAIANAEKGVGK